MNTQFANDIVAGLQANPKKLFSKYFYDETGSRLFQEIMALPEYYLTRSEQEIVERYAGEILAVCLEGSPERRLTIVELGAGDGAKTIYLLRRCLQNAINARFFPIDISVAALQDLSALIQHELPAITLEPLHGEYFDGLARVQGDADTHNLILFLGSNIGNFTFEQGVAFFQRIRSFMRPHDALLVGFDLKKSPAVVLSAYNDVAGITAEFNYNLLRRINNELQGTFDISTFIHAPYYDPESGEARSYLVSTCPQTVEVAGALIHFDAWESIHTEISRKFTLTDIQQIAHKAGFTVIQNFFDEQRYFADSVWKVAQREQE